MKAARYQETGAPSVLSLEDIKRPTPSKGEVLVEIHAASVNPVDVLYRSGFYTPSEFPMTPGSDFAGIVAETGANVEDFSPGERVIGDGINKNTGYQGSFAEYAIAPIERVAPFPSDVSFEQAAAIAHVGLTAWHALFDYGGLQLNDTCLIHGGSGGVGHIAVQLADKAGAFVIATAGSDEKRNRVSELGGDVVLDYTREDLSSVISDNGQPDVILDHMLGEYLELDIEVAAPNGRIVGIEGRTVTFSNAPTARGKNLEIYQIAAGAPPNFSNILETLVELLHKNDVTVEIAREFSLYEAEEAHRHVEERSFVGKVIVTN